MARKHEESDLHLAFCKEIHKQHPNDSFVRHEREGMRSPYMRSLFTIYNKGIEKLPDFEGLITNQKYTGFYLEFKKPGEKWLQRDGKTVKNQYANQYRNHLLLRSMGKAVWFCNDLLAGVMLYNAFKKNQTYPMQDYLVPISDAEKNDIEADKFFGQFGL